MKEDVMLDIPINGAIYGIKIFSADNTPKDIIRKLRGTAAIIENDHAKVCAKCVRFFQRLHAAGDKFSYNGGCVDTEKKSFVCVNSYDLCDKFERINQNETST